MRSSETQSVLQLFRAAVTDVQPGRVRIELAHAEQLTQQHGFLHAGVVATVLDSACGYAAFSLFEAGAGVLTVEYKINLVAPAAGERFEMDGYVVRSGKTLTVCRGDAFAVADGKRSLIATMQATVMTIRGREGITS